MAGAISRDLQAIIGAIPVIGSVPCRLSGEGPTQQSLAPPQHRRAHRIEVYYDDLLVESLNVVPGVEPGNYDGHVSGGHRAARRLGKPGAEASSRVVSETRRPASQKFLCLASMTKRADPRFSRRALPARCRGPGRARLPFHRDAADRLNERFGLLPFCGKKVATPPDSGEEAVKTPDSADSAMDGIDRERPGDADRAVADHEFREKCLRGPICAPRTGKSTTPPRAVRFRCGPCCPPW